MNAHNRRGNRGKLSFKERDASRLMRAARSAGYEVVGVEANILNGTLRVLTATVGEGNNNNQWDEVLANAANEKRPA